ncbi:MAG: Ig-like domain-containing protein, partial [Planctomycetota bacterium]
MTVRPKSSNAKRRNKKRNRKFTTAELLERRELLAFDLASISWNAGTGLLTLDDSLSQTGSKLLLGASPTYVTVNGEESTVPAASVVNIRIDAGTGDDQLDLRDVITWNYSSLQSTTVVGGGGNDFIHGSPVEDTIFGDTEFGTAPGGDDFIDGLAGDDVVHAGEGVDFVLGGNGADALYGDEGNDTLSGEKGFDDIYGGDGDDMLLGGLGQDSLFGNDGNDTLLGEDGNDTLQGNTGDDLLDGGSGNDLKTDDSGVNVVVDDDSPPNAASLPQANIAPIFEYVGDPSFGNVLDGGTITVADGQDVVINVDGLDLNGDQVTFDLSIVDSNQNPASATISLDDENNVFKVSGLSVGQYTATATVSDGFLVTAQSFAIEVTSSTAPTLKLKNLTTLPSQGEFGKCTSNCDPTGSVIIVEGIVRNEFEDDPPGAGMLMPTRTIDVAFDMKDALSVDGEFYLDEVDDLNIQINKATGHVTATIRPDNGGKTFRLDFSAKSQEGAISYKTIYLIVEETYLGPQRGDDDSSTEDHCELLNPTQEGIHASTNRQACGFAYEQAVAFDDHYTTQPVTGTVNFNISDNDRENQLNYSDQYQDENDDNVTVYAIQEQPPNGTASVYESGGAWFVSYTPKAGFAGVDTLTYSISSDFNIYNTGHNGAPDTLRHTKSGVSNLATVKIDVNSTLDLAVEGIEYGVVDEEPACGCSLLAVSDKTGDTSAHHSLPGGESLVYHPPEPTIILDL